MTTDQKLDIVYKKLVASRAYTKEGTQFFEEPFSSFRQVSLPGVYVNSDYIPGEAPKDDVYVHGLKTLTFVENEPMLAIGSGDLSFITAHDNIIPKSYGEGYGITLTTRTGESIDENDFPFVIDWESGELTFMDVAPFSVSRTNPPLATYYSYTGATLGSARSYSGIGPRGNVGPTGSTGPMDSTTIRYRGTTDFSNPSIVYYVNDVVTYETNGNSYVCIDDTNLNPVSDPASWVNISPSGATDALPQSVLFVNDPSLIVTSGLSNTSDSYYTSLQSAIDACPSAQWRTIIVNTVSMDSPLGGSITIDSGKKIHIIFRKWANVFTDVPGTLDFTFSIIDSEVIIENARFGGENVYSSYDVSLANDVIVKSEQAECSARFIDCRFYSKEISVVREGAYDAVAEFVKCSVNATRLLTNSIVRFDACLCTCSITMDSIADSDVANNHEITIRNTFFSSRMGDGRDSRLSRDIVVLARRDDISSHEIKFFNSVIPGFGVIMHPIARSLSPEVFKIESDNCVHLFTRLDYDSGVNGGSLSVVGGNNTSFDSYPTDFVVTYPTFSSGEAVESYLFSKRFVSWDSSTGTTPFAFESYARIASQWNMLSL